MTDSLFDDSPGFRARTGRGTAGVDRRRRCGFRGAFGRVWAVLFLTAVWVASAAPGAGGSPDGRVWSHPMPTFSEEHYRTAVERLFESFEEKTGKQLEPGGQGRVGLKVYTNSGPGLATPRPLVRAVVAGLERRGYDRGDVFLVDISRYRLRQAGFLGRSGRDGDTFEGSPVYVLETGNHFDPDWYYESPLPPRSDFSAFARGGLNLPEEVEAVGRDRLSYLPYPLLHEVDFWINLPRHTDHSALGVNGAVLNATLWNSGNTSRFLNSRSTGPAAAAEMAAIPELRRGWVLNICTLESFQFIGGPSFRSLYTDSLPELWMSADPVLIDALMVREIDRNRKARGFQPLDDFIPVLEYSEQLGVGRNDPDAADWVRLPRAADGSRGTDGDDSQ